MAPKRGQRQNGIIGIVARCIKSTENPERQEFNLNRYGHETITRTLWHFVYNEDEQFQNKSIPLVYNDFSRPEPFPVGCLDSTRLDLADLPDIPVTLDIGLMSLRHPELDYIVDMYATTNSILAEQPTSAIVESRAYYQTLEHLRDSLFDSGGIINAFHTGHQPMVTGFYRAVVEVLLDRKNRNCPRNLVVIPHIYKNSVKNQSANQKFSYLSHGAQRENYRTLYPWW